MEALPYYVPYEYVPFVAPDGKSAVEKLQPTVKDVKELLKSNDYVGYQPGSFVVGLLRKINFDEDRLKAYDTPKECGYLLAKGSSNGGIAAIFDESPYVKLFLANYCSKFTAIGPTYKTDGFGFVTNYSFFSIFFPFFSTRITSRAVLNMTKVLANIAFGDSFVMVVIAAVLALIIFLIKFIHESWHIIIRSNLSLLERSRILSRKFDTKDYSCHTFKKSELRDVLADSTHDLDCSRSTHGNLSVLPSTQTTGSPSPSNSSHTEQILHFPGGGRGFTSAWRE
ncbi:hypothetical protein RDI58_001217 [Solanum bulbocastanum]|uniref:Uncharacterized protein n=1 Tax=Solanum bulbocastanum TaxID=147425 RepID=A0AAN8U946_SOLBU